MHKFTFLYNIRIVLVLCITKLILEQINSTGMTSFLEKLEMSQILGMFFFCYVFCIKLVLTALFVKLY